MIRFIVKRALLAVPLLWGLTTLLFFLLHAAPGKPSNYFLDESFPPEVQAMMERNLGLNETLWVQYGRWLRNAAGGNFQLSLIDRRPVSALILEALPYTLLLSFCALALIFSGGILLGTLQAGRKDSLFDRAASFGSLVLYSIPSFWLGIMLILFFSLKIPLFPASQVSSIGAESLSSVGRLLDRLHHLVLPALALSLAPAAGVSRYVRASLLEVVHQDYMRTAGAKGLDKGRVLWMHGMRNALLPIITLLGLYLPVLFGGSVLVETIFAWPGMGRLIVLKILQRDYPVVLGSTFCFGVTVIAGNLLADILYAIADPRIRYRK
jgi:peptide/nickel transport system permease protein